MQLTRSGEARLRVPLMRIVEAEPEKGTEPEKGAS